MYIYSIYCTSRSHSLLRIGYNETHPSLCQVLPGPRGRMHGDKTIRLWRVQGVCQVLCWRVHHGWLHDRQPEPFLGMHAMPAVPYWNVPGQVRVHCLILAGHTNRLMQDPCGTGDVQAPPCMLLTRSVRCAQRARWTRTWASAGRATTAWYPPSHPSPLTTYSLL